MVEKNLVSNSIIIRNIVGMLKLYLIYVYVIMIGNIIRELLKGDSKGLLKLPTDRVLVEDPEFCRYVELYAEVVVWHIFIHIEIK